MLLWRPVENLHAYCNDVGQPSEIQGSHLTKLCKGKSLRRPEGCTCPDFNTRLQEALEHSRPTCKVGRGLR